MNTSDIDLFLNIKKQRRRSVWGVARSALIFVFVIAVTGSAFGFNHWLVVLYSGLSLGVLGIGIITILAAKFQWARGHREELLDIVQRQIELDEEAMQYLATHQTT